MRVVIAAVLLAALAAGCDDNGQKYSRSDVERAFRSQGLELLAPTGEDRLLAPRTTDEQFVVVIFPNEKDALDALPTLRSESSSVSFDVRQRNVVVTADESVTAPMRERIRGALAELGGALQSSPGVFAGQWAGHTRSLTITHDGHGREYETSGCCVREFALRFRVLGVQGTRARAVATIEFTSTRMFDESHRRHLPHVGEVGTLRLRHGVVTDELTGATFCAGGLVECGL
jgi:hypothetical protein